MGWVGVNKTDFLQLPRFSALLNCKTNRNKFNILIEGVHYLNAFQFMHFLTK